MLGPIMYTKQGPPVFSSLFRHFTIWKNAFCKLTFLMTSIEIINLPYNKKVMFKIFHLGMKIYTKAIAFYKICIVSRSSQRKSKIPTGCKTVNPSKCIFEDSHTKEAGARYIEGPRSLFFPTSMHLYSILVMLWS